MHTEEVGQHGQRADAESTECSCRRNVTIQLVNHRLLAMSAHDHLLLLQLLCHLSSATSTLVCTGCAVINI